MRSLCGPNCPLIWAVAAWASYSDLGFWGFVVGHFLTRDPQANFFEAVTTLDGFSQVLWKGRELDFVPSSNRAGGSEDNLTVMVVQFGGKHQLTAPDVVGWEIYLGQLPSLEGQRKPPRSAEKEGEVPGKISLNPSLCFVWQCQRQYFGLAVLREMKQVLKNYSTRVSQDRVEITWKSDVGRGSSKESS